MFSVITIPWVLVGIAGGAVALSLNEQVIRRIIGVIIVGMLVVYLWRRFSPNPQVAGNPAFYGICTGFATTLANASGPVNWLLGGWQFNGITTLQSGTPLSFTANNTAGLFNPVTWPNSNGKDPKLDGPVDQRLNAYFDKSVFSQPAPLLVAQNTRPPATTGVP